MRKPQRGIERFGLACGLAICDTRLGATPSHWHLELTHQFEHLVALLDFLHRQLTQTLQAECFHTKTGEHASVNHRLAQIVNLHVFDSAGEKSSHAAGKCVPCPGRIVNVFKWVSATTEELIFVAKKQCAVLTLFYRDILGPIFRMRRPALMRLVSFVISRASLSFKIRRFTR